MQTSADITKGYLFFMNSFRKSIVDNESALDEDPPDERYYFDPDDPDAVNNEIPRLGASDILVHAENGTVTSDGGPVVPLGPVLEVNDAGTGSSVPLNLNPSGLYWATDAGTVTVSGFGVTDGADGSSASGQTAPGNSAYGLNTVEIAGDNTCIKVRAADDASVTSTIFGNTINTVIDTAAGNPAEITVTTYADDAPPQSMRLSGTSADGSVRIVQTKDGTLRAAGMKDMKASAAVLNVPVNENPAATNSPAAGTPALSYEEQNALLEKLLADHETSVPDSAPDRAADITMDPDGNGVTAETDVPAPEIIHPDVPQNKDRSIYGTSGMDGACPFCGKVHGSSITEQLTARFHSFLAGLLKPFTGIIRGSGGSTPTLPKIPEKNISPHISPRKWLEDLDLTDRFRKLPGWGQVHRK